MKPLRHSLVYDTPVGPIFIEHEGLSIVKVVFGGPKADIGGFPIGGIREDPVIKSRLEEYFDGRRQNFGLQYSFKNVSSFAENVYKAVAGIPYGQRRTYKWVAERVGLPKAARAVGRALSANPLPLIVPCHRVVASDGTIGGFTPWIEIKSILLELETRYI